MTPSIPTPNGAIISGFVTKKGNVVVTSLHKCKKGKWYYAAKKKLAALKTNPSFSAEAEYDRGWNAGLEFVREYIDGEIGA